MTFTRVAYGDLFNYPDNTGRIKEGTAKINELQVAVEALQVPLTPVASGTSTLVGGTVTVSNTSVTANAIIRLNYSTRGGTSGAVFVSAITASTSFVITSTSGTDTGKVYWEILSY